MRARRRKSWTRRASSTRERRDERCCLPREGGDPVNHFFKRGPRLRGDDGLAVSLRGFAMLKQLVFAALLVSNAALAQTFPTKPIRVVVPFPPGGGTDIVARTVTPKMAEILG